MMEKSSHLINKIHLGDCFDVMANIADQSIDLVLCDLPYGITTCEWDSIIPFDILWESYWRITKPNAAIVLSAAQPFTTALISSQIKYFKYCWIWEKSKATGHGLVKKQPLRSHEDIAVFYKNPPTYNPQMTPGDPYKGRRRFKPDRNHGHGDFRGFGYDNDGTRYPRSILKFKSVYAGDIIHPTQKPVPLFEYLIRTYTDEGATVLDNCSGSATTSIAAINSSRNFICIEKNPEYHARSVKRLEEHKKQERLF